MFSPQQTSTAMELLPLTCLLLTCSAVTSADQNGPVIVKEDSDAILPCTRNTKENIESALFDWKKDKKEVFIYDKGEIYGPRLAGQDQQFKGRVSHFQDKLKYGNASIKISKTKVTDSGVYTCKFPDIQENRIQLIVGAAPKPYVTTLKQTKDGMLLQCEVLGAFPKPKVEWQDSAANILSAKEPQVSERGGSFYIILQTIVRKTDYFRCVATQEEINHQIYAETYVPFNGSFKQSSTGWIVAAFLVLLLFC